MHNLCLMSFRAFRFLTCKASVDALSFLYSKLMLAKLYKFVFGAAIAESHWQLLAYVAALLLTSVWRWLSVRG